MFVHVAEDFTMPRTKSACNGQLAIRGCLAVGLVLATSISAFAEPECHTVDNYAQRAAQILNSYAEAIKRSNDAASQRYATNDAKLKLDSLKCHDTKPAVDKFIAAVRAALKIGCAGVEPTPITGASAATTGAKIPDPEKTTLVGLKFTLNCR